MNNFQDLITKPGLLTRIHEMGFKRPSPLQKKTIPLALLGRFDFLARAETGPDKTAAFCIQALQRIDEDQDLIQGIILVPTPELALRTSMFCKELGKYLNVQVMMVTNIGTNVDDDIDRFHQPVHLIVGTPKRIIDFAKNGICLMGDCSMLVMDEADKLLSPKLQPHVENVFHYIAKNPQILMYSATCHDTVMKFKDRCMHRLPFLINFMDGITFRGMTHHYQLLKEKEKVKYLSTLLSKLQVNQAMIFCNSVKRVELLTKELMKLGCSCLCIHSKMLKDDRDTLLKLLCAFRNGETRILVLDGLFPRGVDSKAVNIVINFDSPTDSDLYLHRVGRSGTVENRCLAITFFAYGELSRLYTFERELEIEIKTLPNFICHYIYPGWSKTRR